MKFQPGDLVEVIGDQGEHVCGTYACGTLSGNGDRKPGSRGVVVSCEYSGPRWFFDTLFDVLFDTETWPMAQSCLRKINPPPQAGIEDLETRSLEGVT